MIKKVGNIYWLDTRIDGRRVRRTLGTDSKYLALRRSQEIIDDLKRELSKKDIKFEKFAEQYLEWAWEHKPVAARRESQRLVIIRDFFRGLKIEYLSEITPLHIEQLRTHLRTRRRKTKNGEKEYTRANSTINRFMQILNVMLNRAIDWELYHKPNPMQKIRAYKEPKTISPLSNAEAEKIIAAAQEIQRKPRSPFQRIFGDLVILTVHTGLRRTEALNIRWTDIKDNKLEVVGKGKKRRVIPLNNVARGVIERQPRRTEFIFHIPNRDSGSCMHQTIMRLRRMTDLDFHFHLCRHTFATRLLAAGIDIVTIAEILGHSKMMTALLYSHSTPDRKKRAVEALETQTRGHIKRTQTQGPF